MFCTPEFIAAPGAGRIGHATSMLFTRRARSSSRPADRRRRNPRRHIQIRPLPNRNPTRPELRLRLCLWYDHYNGAARSRKSAVPSARTERKAHGTSFDVITSRCRSKAKPSARLKSVWTRSLWEHPTSALVCPRVRPLSSTKSVLSRQGRESGNGVPSRSCALRSGNATGPVHLDAFMV